MVLKTMDNWDIETIDGENIFNSIWEEHRVNGTALERQILSVDYVERNRGVIWCDETPQNKFLILYGMFSRYH